MDAARSKRFEASSELPEACREVYQSGAKTSEARTAVPAGGVCPGYYSLIYNNGCAYTTQGAATDGAPKEAVKQEGPVMMLSAAKPQERFDAIDTNHNGSISFEEAEAWVKKQQGGPAISTADLQAKFQAGRQERRRQDRAGRVRFHARQEVTVGTDSVLRRAESFHVREKEGGRALKQA